MITNRWILLLCSSKRIQLPSPRETDRTTSYASCWWTKKKTKVGKPNQTHPAFCCIQIVAAEFRLHQMPQSLQPCGLTTRRSWFFKNLYATTCMLASFPDRRSVPKLHTVLNTDYSLRALYSDVFLLGLSALPPSSGFWPSLRCYCMLMTWGYFLLWTNSTVFLLLPIIVIMERNNVAMDLKA